MERVNLTICVVTYKRLWKWTKLMFNLKSVYANKPECINLNFLFIEDKKSPNWIYMIKDLIASLVLFGKYRYEFGQDNLGESRDYAVKLLHESKVDYFGFIDDDDYYDPDKLSYIYPWMSYNTYDIINFGMSGNFYIPDPNRPEIGSVDDKYRRLRKWDDDNVYGCVPSMACFIKLDSWKESELSFGFNPPSEETSPLMVFTLNSNKVANIGINAMFRNRGSKSLVKDMSIYHTTLISHNIDTHIFNLRKYSKSNEEYEFLVNLFAYNYGSYLKCHGCRPEMVDNEIELAKLKYKYNE